MELIKNNWNYNDIQKFQAHLKTFERPLKHQWTKKIVNTKLPVLSILSTHIKTIIKQISKGNYLEFLDLNITEYFENVTINGSLICKIKDFKLMKKYLYKYTEEIENWANCDMLDFNINKNNKKEFFNLSNEFLKSTKPFVRRVGIIILFKFVDDDEYINKIFNIINGFANEENYYVNMCLAWLFCELFIKRKNQTLHFLNSHSLNKFVINKGIQKCRDSFRVSKQDKDMLLKYKVNFKSKTV